MDHPPHQPACLAREDLATENTEGTEKGMTNQNELLAIQNSLWLLTLDS